MRLGILTSHPIQYQSPWFRALAKEADLEVFFAHRQSAAEQGQAGFGVAFDWDVDLLSGYKHRFLTNVSGNPGVNHFSGCDTPEIEEIIGKAESRKQKAENDKNTQNRKQKTEGDAKTESRKQNAGTISDFNSPLSTFSFPPFDAFIVTGWYLKCYRQAARACRRAGVPVLVRGDSQLGTPRSWLKRLGMEVRQRWLLRKFDGFLSVGQRHREYLEHFGVPAEKIVFAPHFVDNEWFRVKAETARKQKAEIRKEWGVAEDAFCVLFCGKFMPLKRPMDLVEAARLLLQQKAESRKQKAPDSALPNIHLLFVGSGELGAQLRAACHVVFDAEIPNFQLSTFNFQLPHATFAGFLNQTEISKAYAAADVLVLPSDSETWGLVVNEAMASGLPAIVSDAVGCAPDLIEEEKTGFTFPTGDSAALARRLGDIARLKEQGHDFAPALAKKMEINSVTAAVEGTIRAVSVLGNLPSHIPESRSQ